MAQFPGPNQVSREIDYIGIRDLASNIYVNGTMAMQQLKDQLEENGWPMPESIVVPADVTNFNTYKAALQTALADAVKNITLIVQLINKA